MEEFMWELQDLVRSPLPEPLTHVSPSPVQETSLSPSQRLRIAQDEMRRNGWCAHQVRHLSRTFDLSTFTYLASIKPHPHRQISHEQCSMCNSCVAYNTDASTYQTRHVTPGCTCVMVRAPYRSLTSIIRKKMVPLISIEYEDGFEGQIELSVHARSRTSKYVAISHVWVDGLGNPRENALPTCQLIELRRSIKALHSSLADSEGPFLFWMDTLCIPVQQADLTLQLDQIARMASIYKGAVASLVLDAELMDTLLPYDYNTRKLWPESRARIACSAWMTRSWTLQEGALPPAVAIKCARDIIVFDYSGETSMELERLYTQTQRAPPYQWQPPQMASPSKFRDYIHAESERDDIGVAIERELDSVLIDTRGDFASAWNKLCFRSTTHSEDIPLILTNIIDLKSRPLFKYHQNHERILAIILSLKHPPLSLFFNTGPRYEPGGNHNNRWLPREVSGDTILATGKLSVHSSYLTYIWGGDVDGDNDNHVGDYRTLSIYTVDGVVSMHSAIYLLAEGDDDFVYKADPSTESHTDQLDTTGLTTTYFMIHEGPLLNGEDKQRGACFYSGPIHRTRKGKHANVDLIFNCPVRVARQDHESRDEFDPSRTFTLTRLRTPRQLNIKYDRLKGFTTLNPRQKAYSRFNYSALIFFLIGSLSFVGIFAGISQYATADLTKSKFGNATKWKGIYFGLFPGVCLLLVGAYFFFPGEKMYKLMIERYEWKYILSYEAVAVDRRRDRREV
ncbi:hypothetical protein GGR57DRAFT_485354 [Xylariaceae sp. FL1272]|nr:hypothetical protein GGR57DRAFT_485354 [Xylariaceae sp. FL1272]